MVNQYVFKDCKYDIWYKICFERLHHRDKKSVISFQFLICDGNECSVECLIGDIDHIKDNGRNRLLYENIHSQTFIFTFFDFDTTFRFSLSLTSTMRERFIFHPWYSNEGLKWTWECLLTICGFGDSKHVLHDQRLFLNIFCRDWS